MSQDIRDGGYGDNKQYVAAIDFGTSGSGVVWGVANVAPGQEVRFNIAHSPGNSNYAKSPTAMLVRKSLLSRLNSLGDRELNVIYNEFWNDRCNVCIGDMAYQQYFRFEHPGRRNNGAAAGEWVLFEQFKMALYTSSDNRRRQRPTVRGSDGVEYDLEGIITLYLQCLKLTTFKHIRDNGVAFENMAQSIRWGITIPTIWGSAEKGIMERAAEKALGSDEIIFLLEPEGAARSFELNPNLSQLLKVGTTFMVVDCGGGTIDVVVHRIRPNLSFEEVIKERGNAMGGWEFDRRFFQLMAEKLAESIPEVPRDRAYEMLIEQFYNDDPSGKYELDKAWEEKKRNNPEAGIAEFTIPGTYQRWFQSNYKVAADQLIDEFGFSLSFTADEIRRAFQPVISQIADLLVRAYNELRSRGGGDKLDYIFGAGGLIALPSIQACIQESTRTSSFRAVRGNGFDAERHCLFASNMRIEQTCAGGSIVMGAAHILVRKADIVRIARKYYYLKINLTVRGGRDRATIERRLQDYYQEKLQQIQAPENVRREIMEELARSFRRDFSESLLQTNDGELQVLFLDPVVFKNMSIQNFDGTYYPVNKLQNRLQFLFYSSEHILLFPKDEMDGLVKEEFEGSNSFEIEPNHRERGYRLTVDFNETQQNYFVIKVFDEDGHERMSNRLRPDLKLGH